MSLAFKKNKHYLSAFINAAILKKPKVDGLPLSVSIEASSVCNLTCKYCYQKDWDKNIKRGKGMMPLPLFKKFIEEVGNSTYPININFDLGGEPFLNPDLMEMVDLACTYGKLTNITTNATLLDYKLIDRILESGLNKLSISLDIVNGVNLRGGCSVPDIVAKVDNLISRRKKLRKRGPRIVIRSINLKGTSSKYMLSLFRMKPDAVIFTPATNWAGLIDLIPSNNKYYRCLLPWLEMAMLYNGDFALCCNDPRGDLIVGRFPAESVAEVWQGKKLNEARRIIAKKSLAFIVGQNCQKCTRLRKKLSLKEWLYFIVEN